MEYTFEEAATLIGVQALDIVRLNRANAQAQARIAELEAKCEQKAPPKPNLETAP